MLTEKQLEMRLKGIAATEIGFLAYPKEEYYGMTLLDLYLLKTGQANYSRKNSVRTRRGELLEPLVAELFEKETGLTATKCDGTFCRDEPSCKLFATPDYLLNNSLLECKTAYCADDKWGPSNSGQFPDRYLLQVAMQCLVTGINHAYLAVLFDNDDFRVYEYVRSPELEDGIKNLAALFWERVQKRIPPEPATLADVNKIYKVIDPNLTACADMDIDEAIAKYKKIHKMRKDLEAQEEEIKIKILQSMGDAKTLFGIDGKKAAIRYEIKRDSLKKELLKSAYPEIWNEFTEQKTSMAMRIL